jgi:hypothetical protein
MYRADARPICMDARGSAAAFKRTVRSLPTLGVMKRHLPIAFADEDPRDDAPPNARHSHRVGQPTALRRPSRRYKSTQRAVFPSLEQLDGESETIDRWYVDTTASLPPDELARPRDVRFTDGKVVTMTAATMILHVVTHTIHHRGNVDAVM